MVRLLDPRAECVFLANSQGATGWAPGDLVCRMESMDEGMRLAKGVEGLSPKVSPPACGKEKMVWLSPRTLQLDRVRAGRRG